MPVPTQPSLLEHVLGLLDAVAEDRGWGSPPLLFGVGQSDGPEAEFELAVKEVDGHPAEALLGFAAPSAWTAMGVSAEGWAYPYPEAAHDHRPGAPTAMERERVRSLVLLGRDGRVVGRLRWQDGRVVDEAPAEGLVLECLRRALDSQATSRHA